MSHGTCPHLPPTQPLVSSTALLIQNAHPLLWVIMQEISCMTHMAYGIDLQAGCQSFLSSRLTRLRPAWRLATRHALQGTSKRAMQQVHCHLNTALPARVLTSSTLVSVVRADCSRHDHHEEHAHDCACHHSGSAFNVSRRQLLWAAAGVSLAAQTNLPAAAAGAPAGKTQYSADGMRFNAAWHRKV